LQARRKRRKILEKHQFLEKWRIVTLATRNRRVSKCVDPPIFSKIGVFAEFCGVFCALASARPAAQIFCASKFWTRKKQENGVRGLKFGVLPQAVVGRLDRGVVSGGLLGVY